MARMHRSVKGNQGMRVARARRHVAEGRHVAEVEFRYSLDRHGTQHFNFEQHVWIEQSVAMAFTPVCTTALETLAINLLALAAQPDRARPHPRSDPSRLIPMVRDFCEQCLLSAPQDGWVLPRPAIRAWMHARRRQRCRQP